MRHRHIPLAPLLPERLPWRLVSQCWQRLRLLCVVVRRLFLCNKLLCMQQRILPLQQHMPLRLSSWHVRGRFVNLPTVLLSLRQLHGNAVHILHRRHLLLWRHMPTMQQPVCHLR